MASMESNDSHLKQQFELGILRTLWKSHMLTKSESLRAALDLNLREKALPEGTYDREAVNQLWEIDFSSLGWLCNFQKAIVLIFAGAGLTPATPVDDPVLLVGDSDSDSDFEM